MGKVHDLNKRLDAIRHRHPANDPKVYRIVYESHETLDDAIGASQHVIAPGDYVIARKIVDVDAA